MANKLLAVAVVFSMLSGCFTAAGTLIGGSVTQNINNSRELRANNNDVDHLSVRNGAIVGGVAGAALDVVMTVVLVSSLGSQSPDRPYQWGGCVGLGPCGDTH